MKHKIIRLIIILFILGIAGTGFWYFRQQPERWTQLKLRLGLISQDELSGVYTASGYIEADEVQVAAELKGRIARLVADEGDFVKAGQVLVDLDTALLDAQVHQAQAKIAVARAQLAKIEVGVRAEEIARAEAAVKQAEAKAAAAHLLWQDAIALRDHPQELDLQIDAAQTNLKVAQLRIEQAIPFKEAAVAMSELRQQNWEITQEGLDVSFFHPVTGKKISLHREFPEGAKQQSSVDWNLATADEWQKWVDLNSAQTAKTDAETILADLWQLKNDPQAAQVKVAQAQTAYQTALAEVAVAQAKLDILAAGAREEQIEIAQAQVKQAEAALVALQVQRDQHTLTAPLDGWVSKRTAHQGEMANPGASLLTLADLNHLTLTVYVSEPMVGQVALGQTVEVYVDTFPGQPFKGQIIFISPEAEFTPKNVQTKEERVNTVFAVKIRLEDQNQQLKPGMPADVVLSGGPKL
jgi:HlyD family secretion protein